ncbi:MAG TPA: hypothetical protein VF461_21125 [Gemmatimonadaceae bacterium]
MPVGAATNLSHPSGNWVPKLKVICVSAANKIASATLLALPFA